MSAIGFIVLAIRQQFNSALFFFSYSITDQTIDSFPSCDVSVEVRVCKGQ